MKRETVKRGAPVILFPIAGCEAVGALDEAQFAALRRGLRETIRAHWTEPGVQAVIALMELRAAEIQKRCLARDATAHDAGQGFGVGELVGLLRMLPISEEAG